MDNTLPVMEIFGPTLQGEGALIGIPTYFIRLGGCDYRCSWCDSMHAVDPAIWKKKAERLEPEGIVHRLGELPKGPLWITLSGGNPAIHECGALVTILQDRGYKVALETQGTIYKPWIAGCDLVTVSPKGPSSETETPLNITTTFFDKLRGDFFTGNKVIKIVIADEADLSYASRVAKLKIGPTMYLQPCNMDYGKDISLTYQRLKLLSDLVTLQKNVTKYPDLRQATILPQLHVLLWGNKIGV